MSREGVGAPCTGEVGRGGAVRDDGDTLARGGGAGGDDLVAVSDGAGRGGEAVVEAVPAPPRPH